MLEAADICAQGNTTARFQSMNSSSPSCSADKPFHPACSAKWKLERGICGRVLINQCLDSENTENRAPFVSLYLMQSRAEVRGTPCNSESSHKQMSAHSLGSTLHVDKMISQCKRES